MQLHEYLTIYKDLEIHIQIPDKYSRLAERLRRGNGQNKRNNGASTSLPCVATLRKSEKGALNALRTPDV